MITNIILFCSIFIFFINIEACNKHRGVGYDAGLGAAKEVHEMLREALNPSINGGIQASKVLGTDHLSTASKNVTNCIDNNMDKITESHVKASTGFGSEAAGKIADAASTVSTVAACAYAGVQAFNTLSNMYSYYWPSDEEKVRQTLAKQQREFLDAKEEFKKCLNNNTKSERRKSSGIPCNCKTFANKFAMAGGETEVENLTRTFNKCYKQGEQ